MISWPAICLLLPPGDEIGVDDLGHGMQHDVHVDQLREVEVNLETDWGKVSSEYYIWEPTITSSFEKVNNLLPIYSNTPGSLELKR